ncbi:hypothetical protein PRB81_gp29 [Klebsiella phage VLCpiS13f]|uniref:hypothetical protein n=1 Tax=Klebsiella phage VLCpiS13f TaxID=2874890 RepID=UPI00233EBED1|nr:hypothetical protein PRB81_gp29 [Klebsiella phage VLCpiS13f]UVX29576.1 hypothetical protein S13f_00067 [Klebsiella phage VLCpiS13f]
MIDITELAQSLKAAAEKVTALNLDTAQEVRDEDGYLECPVCGGEGSVDSERDYCNIDGVALGIQFYGIGEHHGLAEQYFRIATPSNILSLIEGLEKAQQRISQLESRTVKLPDGWQFEECEMEGCENGAIFSVGTGGRNIHLCDKCAHESQNSRLKKSPLSKRLPFKMAAGIKVEAE